MLKAQIHLIRAALDAFEAAVQAGDLRRAARQAGEIESLGLTLRVEMELAASAPPARP
jgi:hypothetical protein